MRHKYNHPGYAEKRDHFHVRKSPEGGYVARALDYPICMQADTMDDLRVNVADAVRCHINDGEPLPEVRLVERHFMFRFGQGHDHGAR